MVKTQVTIGPAAKKPLELEIPLIITGMSYGGALSKSPDCPGPGGNCRRNGRQHGESAFIPEERESATRYIYQYHRGRWPHGNQTGVLCPGRYDRDPTGTGRPGFTPQTTPAQKIDEELREIFGLKEGEDAVIASRLPGVESKEDLKNLVFRLKEETGGVPVAYKFAATHYGRGMEIALFAGVDVVVIDGAEAGTHAAPAAAGR